MAVVASVAAFRRALGLRAPPDFFELRLDALGPILPELEPNIGKLPAPLIITARHPAEGGLHNLSAAERRQLLLRFLPQANFIDIELRSTRELRAVLQQAKDRGVKQIISVHEMNRFIELNGLERQFESIEALRADVFKIVTRTETAAELADLLEFFQHHKNRLMISAMGTGRFGRESRIKLARAGSVLNYVHLGRPQSEGQLSLAELRRGLKG